MNHVYVMFFGVASSLAYLAGSQVIVRPHSSVTHDLQLANLTPSLGTEMDVAIC